MEKMLCYDSNFHDNSRQPELSFLIGYDNGRCYPSTVAIKQGHEVCVVKSTVISTVANKFIK